MLTVRTALVAILVTAAFGAVSIGAQTVPTITVANVNDSWLEIVPIDAAHRAMIPHSLDDVLPELPPGSFLVKNLTASPLNVIVTKWSYKEQNGTVQQLSLYCDAYLSSPVEPLANPHDISLVSPGGCGRQEYFGRLKKGNFFGSPLNSPRNKAILDVRDKLAAVEISIDSAIFGDGQIWGPDKLHYYTTIMQRHAAAQSVAQELSAAKAAGEDLSSHIERIQSEARTKKDRFSWLRAEQAGMIHDSPNPEGTLRWLQQQSPLPEFHHIGEQK